MHSPLTLWIITDGKPGHENQSLGLADAMARLREVDAHTISIAGGKSVLGRVALAKKAARGLPRPDFIIATGHATHLPLLLLARQTGARSVVLMRPSLPLSWFGYCITPEHDFPAGTARPNLILTRGALNRVRVSNEEKTLNLVLLGGPSKTHGWDGEAMLDCLAQATRLGEWLLTDSRRTPAGFIEQVAARCPQVTCVPWQETPQGWVPDKLAKAKQVWVSEDSVSMVYEALTSGANVGLLPVPRARENARTLRGLDSLVATGYLTPFAEWQKTGVLNAPPEPLHEADRCARELFAKAHF